LSFDKIAIASSHVASTSRTMFIKPKIYDDKAQERKESSEKNITEYYSRKERVE
jgi:hypothetical protein